MGVVDAFDYCFRHGRDFMMFDALITFYGALIIVFGALITFSAR